MSLTPGQRSEIERIARATMDATASRTTGPQLRPGTVRAFDAPTATVAIDGDEAPMRAVSLLGYELIPGDRVMVTFDPPQGVTVTGLITPPRGAPGCELVAPAGTITGLSAFGGVTCGYDDLFLWVSQPGALYRLAYPDSVLGAPFLTPTNDEIGAVTASPQDLDHDVIYVDIDTNIIGDDVNEFYRITDHGAGGPTLFATITTPGPVRGLAHFLTGAAVVAVGGSGRPGMWIVSTITGSVTSIAAGSDAQSFVQRAPNNLGFIFARNFGGGTQDYALMNPSFSGTDTLATIGIGDDLAGFCDASDDTFHYFENGVLRRVALTPPFTIDDSPYAGVVSPMIGEFNASTYAGPVTSPESRSSFNVLLTDDGAGVGDAAVSQFSCPADGDFGG